MIRRDLKTDPSILAGFDWANDYYHTRDYAAAVCPERLPELDRAYSHWLLGKTPPDVPVRLQTVRIYGYSDDLIEVDGDLGRHEFSAWGAAGAIPGTTAGYQGRLHLHRLRGTSLRVHCIYDGTWSFAVDRGEPSEPPESTPQDWFIVNHTWGADYEYSDTLEIQCPEGTTLSFIAADGSSPA